MTAIFGLLVGAACSNGVPQAVADAVVTLTAAEVRYDPSVSGLAAEDVQAALDELSTRLDAVPSAATVTEAVAQQTDPLVSRLDAIEATTVSAGAIPVTGIDGADNVESALSSMQQRLAAVEQGSASQVARIVELENQVAALVLMDESLVSKQDGTQAQLDAMGECPDGYGDLGSTCMEPTDRPPGNFHGAVGMCAFHGMHICTATEYLTACSAAFNTTIDETMWTASVLGDATVLGALGTTCTFAGFFVPVTDLNAGRSFRCCYTK
jgi:hypothetical protein